MRALLPNQPGDRFGDLLFPFRDMAIQLKTSGVHHVALKDPDRIAWEFYMA
ncbi:MAG: hypothetical protein M3Z18_09020 [Gemmatimonadota bacterium]|nr:hypothetical protein [Gemmatimonadota bacterium]